MKLKPLHLVFLAAAILFVFACVFWRERIYGDAAVLLFWLINDQQFITAHNRPTVLVIEILPRLLSHWQAPLKYVLLGFSVGEWLWYALCTGILLRLKDVKAAIGLWLVYFISMRYNYFNPVSELILAVPLIFIFFSYLNRERIFKWYHYLASGLLALGIVFSHPLHMLLFPALYVLDCLVRKNYGRERIGIFGFILLAEGVRYFFLDGYDRSPMGAAHHTITIKEYLNKFLSIHYIKDAGLAYVSTLMLLAVICRNAFKQRNKWLLAFVTCFCLGHWLLVNVKMGFLYPDSFEPYERYMMPVPIAAGFIFAFYVFDSTRVKHLLLVSGIFIFQGVLLGKYAAFVSNRYDVFAMAIENAYQYPESKFLYRKENYLYRDISSRVNGHAWVQPQEAILLSALVHPYDPRQVFMKEILPDEFYSNFTATNFLYSPDFWLKDYESLNPAYFPMHTTASRRANTDTIQVNQPDAFFSNITIEPHAGYSNLPANKEQLIHVRITNKNPELLYSGIRKERMMIAYRWAEGEQDMAGENLFRTTPLQCDVKTGINQPVWVMTPARKGKYDLKWYLFFEESNTWKALGNVSAVVIQ